MITATALLVVGVFQAAFIVLLLVLLLTLHRRRGSEHAETAMRALREPLRMLLLGVDDGRALAAGLAQLRRTAAVRQLLSIAASQVPAGQLRALAALVRPAPWITRTLDRGWSRFWWRRMEAARLLAVVYTPADLPMLTALVGDDHPAVASAATAAISECGDEVLIVALVHNLWRRPSAVRLQQMRALRSHSETASVALINELHRGGSALQVGVLIQLAEMLGNPAALSVVVSLASHPAADVRIAVARTLRSCYSAEAVVAASHLLRDDDWRVRAAAARALAGLNRVETIPELENALHDGAWWVRFRAALALGGLGQGGAMALAAASEGNDEYARDIADVVGGLSDAARFELSA